MLVSFHRRLSTAAAAASFSVPIGAGSVFRAPLEGVDAKIGLQVIALNAPPVNALSSEVLSALAAAIRAAEADKSCRGLVLASASSSTSGLGPLRPFSAGLDIREMAGATEVSFARFWGSVQDVFCALWPSTLPIVAAIDGSAPAGGCWLGLLTDARVLVDTPKAVIGLNEVALGIVAPSWFATPLERVVGTRRAESMLCEGSLLTPSDALRAGLVDEVAPAGGAVLSAAAARATRLALVPAAARAATKKLLRGPLLAETLGSPELRAADLQRTWAFFNSKGVQQGLEAYIAALAARPR
jgi:3,2-trans-enoyl-CoA isomerase